MLQLLLQYTLQETQTINLDINCKNTSVITIQSNIDQIIFKSDNQNHNSQCSAIKIEKDAKVNFEFESQNLLKDCNININIFYSNQTNLNLIETNLIKLQNEANFQLLNVTLMFNLINYNNNMYEIAQYMHQNSNAIQSAYFTTTEMQRIVFNVNEAIIIENYNNSQILIDIDNSSIKSMFLQDQAKNTYNLQIVGSVIAQQSSFSLFQRAQQQVLLKNIFIQLDLNVYNYQGIIANVNQLVSINQLVISQEITSQYSYPICQWINDNIQISSALISLQVQDGKESALIGRQKQFGRIFMKDCTIEMSNEADSYSLILNANHVTVLSCNIIDMPHEKKSKHSLILYQAKKSTILINNCTLVGQQEYQTGLIYQSLSNWRNQVTLDITDSKLDNVKLCNYGNINSFNNNNQFL